MQAHDVGQQRVGIGASRLEATVTALHDFLQDGSSPLTDLPRFNATVAMLRSIGIRYLVVHGGDYAPAGKDAKPPRRP